MRHRRPSILVFSGAYLPGFKAGGPTQSVANLVEHLGDEFDFSIVAADRDLGDNTAFPGIAINTWLRVGKASVWYEQPTGRGVGSLRRLLEETPHDALYLNSFFSGRWTLRPLVAHAMLARRAPIIIAPRGQFSPGALGLKHWKKQPYATLMRRWPTVRRAHWQATTADEAELIRLEIDRKAWISIAPNLPGLPQTTEGAPITRNVGDLKVLFLSRVSPMKNLDFALGALRFVRSQIEFTICGPREDNSYWGRCEALISHLPPNVGVHIRDGIPPSEVPATMVAHDLFFLPTRGENYGHVIAEALSVGTPVLISDQTPWRNLERDGLGWDLPLDDETAFARVVDRVAAMTPEARAGWRARIRRGITPRLITPEAIEQNRQLFLTTIAAGTKGNRNGP